ncbi:MAG: methyltransferase domain-containing protein [Candidatus Omnitrophica bacterium]|nr:methyltransferase domain-containing protein [Candidatus Omnitrophota bacterium]
MPSADAERCLRRFLEANWLKPFDAVWDASVASVLASMLMGEPSLDMGCGDGLFMLIASGGRVRLSYDRYTDTRLRLRGDLYDTAASMTRLEATPPRRLVTVGLDHKAGLLDKARRTATYRSLVQGDGQALPFAHRSFATVFCNILYWLPDWQAGLREMHRVVRDDGRLVLVVPNDTFGGQLQSHHRAQRYRRNGRHWRARFFEWIDNGRFRTLTRLTGHRAQWEERLTAAGFRLHGAIPVLHVGAVRRWDMSTRPILHGLVLLGRALQSLRLKGLLKRLIVPLLARRVRPWFAKSLAPSAEHAALWVLIAQPVEARRASVETMPHHEEARVR